MMQCGSASQRTRFTSKPKSCRKSKSIVQEGLSSRTCIYWQKNALHMTCTLNTKCHDVWTDEFAQMNLLLAMPYTGKKNRLFTQKGGEHGHSTRCVKIYEK